jgi:hypothetical protein
MYLARPPEPTAKGERGWHLLDRRPFDLYTVPRHRRHGEGEALSLRDVRKAVQEPQRSQVPSRTRPEMQSRVGTAVRRTACFAGAECRCECCRRRHDGYGYVHVLNACLTVVGIASRFSTIAPYMIPTVRIRHLHGVLRHRSFCVFLLGALVLLKSLRLHHIYAFGSAHLGVETNHSLIPRLSIELDPLDTMVSLLIDPLPFTYIS